jgi:hypothetical protein
MHFRYLTREQFCSEYEDLLKNTNKDEIISEILVEQERRKHLEIDSLKRQELIKNNYNKLYPEIFDFKVMIVDNKIWPHDTILIFFQDEYLTDDFLKIFRNSENLVKDHGGI